MTGFFDLRNESNRNNEKGSEIEDHYYEGLNPALKKQIVHGPAAGTSSHITNNTHSR